MFQLQGSEMLREVKDSYLLTNIQLAVSVRESLNKSEYLQEATKITAYINQLLDSLNNTEHA